MLWPNRRQKHDVTFEVGSVSYKGKEEGSGVNFAFGATTNGENVAVLAMEDVPKDGEDVKDIQDEAEMSEVSKRQEEKIEDEAALVQDQEDKVSAKLDEGASGTDVDGQKQGQDNVEVAKDEVKDVVETAKDAVDRQGKDDGAKEEKGDVIKEEARVQDDAKDAAATGEVATKEPEVDDPKIEEARVEDDARKEPEVKDAKEEEKAASSARDEPKAVPSTARDEIEALESVLDGLKVVGEDLLRRGQDLDERCQRLNEQIGGMKEEDKEEQEEEAVVDSSLSGDRLEDVVADQEIPEALQQEERLDVRNVDFEAEAVAAAGGHAGEGGGFGFGGADGSGEMGGLRKRTIRRGDGVCRPWISKRVRASVRCSVGCRVQARWQ